MSNAALNWAFSTPIRKASDKLLLVCLANYADEFGECFPSQSRVIQDTSLDRKTVIAGLKRLSIAGLVKDTGGRKGVTGRIVIYRLAVNAQPVVVLTVPEAGQYDGDKMVPYFPSNGPVFPGEWSRISHPMVPETGHRTTIEPPLNHQEEPPLPPQPPKEAVEVVQTTPVPTIAGGGEVIRHPGRSKASVDEPPEFLAFWKAYPRKKEGPGAARKPWHRATSRATPEEIMAGLASYAFNASEGGRWLPQAATWLNQERWRGTADTAPQSVVVPFSNRLALSDVIAGRPVGSLQATVAGRRAAPSFDSGDYS